MGRHEHVCGQAVVARIIAAPAAAHCLGALCSPCGPQQSFFCLGSWPGLSGVGLCGLPRPLALLRRVPPGGFHSSPLSASSLLSLSLMLSASLPSRYASSSCGSGWRWAGLVRRKLQMRRHSRWGVISGAIHGEQT